MTAEKNKKLKTFKSLGHCLQFKIEVERGFRYVRDKGTNEFLDTVIATSVGRKVSVCKDKRYWRAQIGCVENRHVFSPYPSKRMKPLLDKAKEGRANPKGIPCLYLATNIQTAIQEVRSWLGSHVSVAQFQIVKDLELVDCSEHTHGLDSNGLDSLFSNQKGEKLSGSDIENRVWSWIDREFSMPVDPSDDTANYVPTQILAELFKANGYDGIVYNSLFAEGKNLALFNIDSAEILDCKLYQITEIPPFKFREITYNF